MSEKISILDIFEELQDPRRAGGNMIHPLSDLIFLVISAVVCGADEWTKIEDFGESQLEWLRQYRPFENGIPSHDTLGRIFSRLNPEAFGQCFVKWTQHLAELTQGEVIPIDGKTLRGSHDRTNGKEAIHLVSAFASNNNMTVGQVKVDSKSNEISAIPALLALLKIDGCVVTIDAMGTQKAIAGQIIDQQADYVLALKENQPTLLEEVKHAFDTMPLGFSAEKVDADHGRVEQRKCEVIQDLRFVDEAANWPALNSVVRLTSTRTRKTDGQQSTQVRYFISSLTQGEAIAQAIRTHWHIENRLHWILDVQFREDDQRKRLGDSAQNFAIIAKVALNLLQQETSLKRGVATRRLKAGWDLKYRAKVLQI